MKTVAVIGAGALAHRLIFSAEKRKDCFLTTIELLR